MTRETVPGVVPPQETVEAEAQTDSKKSLLNRRNFGWLFLATLATVAGGSAVAAALSRESEQSVASSGNQAETTQNFPQCDFAHGGFVEVDQNGQMYQCLDGQWEPVGSRPIVHERHSYINVQKSFRVGIGPVNIVSGEGRFERFIPGDVDASLRVTLGNTPLIDTKVTWHNTEGTLDFGASR